MLMDFSLLEVPKDTVYQYQNGMDYKPHANVTSLKMHYFLAKIKYLIFLEILCQPLPKIPFGSYDSVDCIEQKSPYGTNCTITCNEGFDIKGPSLKTCGGSRNGVWSQKNKIPRCVDVTPPTIVCPKNYSIELNGSKSFVLLSEFKPLEVIKGIISMLTCRPAVDYIVDCSLSK